MSKNYLYISGPMTGKPYFNLRSFQLAEEDVHTWGMHFEEIFNPPVHDIAKYGDHILMSPTGDPGYAVANGFNLRDTLYDDVAFITKKATHILMLRDWEDSKGARAEHALAKALGIEIIYRNAPEAA